MFTFLSSFLAAAGMFGLAATAGLLFRGSEAKKLHREITSREAATSYGNAAAIAAAVFLVNLFASRTAGHPFWSWFLLLAALAISVYLVFWWHCDGSSVREMIPFVAMMLPMHLTVSAASEAVGTNIAGIGAGIVSVIPAVVLVGSLGFFASNLLRFRAGYSEHPVALKRASWIVAIMAASICIAMVVKAVATAAGRVETLEVAAAETVEEEVEESDFPYFYNTLLQDNETTEDDFNFGPSLVDLKALGGVAVDEESLTAEDYDADYRERLLKDPALGAATMAWADSILGTRYLGTFYESCDEDWAETINSAVAEWSENQAAYTEKVEAFCAFLDTAKVSLKDGQKVLEDQMYMNPYTGSEIPDVIVMETDDQPGNFLIYTFTIKGNTFEVAYRTVCGYQPTDVSKVMNITPVTKPSSPSKTEETKPTPDPTPTPTPSNGDDPKDKSEGTQGELVQPNDDPGPGESTNNGTGAQYSSEQQDNASVNESYQEYKEEINNLNDTNSTQKEGGDSNEPSYTPSTSNTSNSSSENKVTVDNNGATGTGNGSADTATPVTEPAKTSAGETVRNADEDDAGEAWGGPPD